MIEIHFSQVTVAIRALLPTKPPGELRLWGVLDGTGPGKILVDDRMQPTWVVVQDEFGTLFLGGVFDHALLKQIVEYFRKSGEVLYGFWENGDPYEALLPRTEYDGRVLEFYERRGDLSSYGAPEECELRDMDKLQENCRGFCLMRGDDILSEAIGSPVINGFVEIGTSTNEPYLRRGYATIVCAHVIRMYEQEGYKTYWNCAKQNTASTALARKLGYYDEKEYRLYGWFPRD
jgi:RimJ/RimL family protein N-acetyltransferase